MASGDVIVIEDTPPSSPVKSANQKQQPIVSSGQTMYYQPQNHEFPVAEQAMIWSRNTTNFIKRSMTSVQQNNRMPFLNNNMQSKPHLINMGNRPILPRNGLPFSGIRNLPRPPYTIFSNYEHYVNSYYQLNGFAPLGNSAYLNNLCNHNFWMKVKLEELPDKGEIVSQYYIDDTQTPVKMNNENDNLIPEFVDINTLANKLQNEQNIQSNPTRFTTLQTNEHSLTLSTETDDKKRNKNSVPLFLKRNRPGNNNIKMKIPEDSESRVDINHKEDNDDIIFIGEFKNDEKLPHVSEAKENIINNSNECNQTESSSSEQSFKEDTKDTENHETDSKYSYKYGKRKRKDRTLIPLRRNPKRQVQIEKDFLKMIDDVIMESEREEKQKKNPNYKPNKPPVKTAIKQCRRSPRILVNSGAVYNPPSPLTSAHIRDWPTEGMHERPEYDPVSGKIKPFDSFICNITNEYNAANNEQDIDEELVFKHKFILSSNLEKDKSFQELCHEMLHHVIAYVATVKSLERDENRFKEKDTNKDKFLEQLDLTKNDEKIENKICDILQSIVNDVTSKDGYEKQSDTMANALAELLKNTILFYCLTNNVEKSDVAKYIATVKPEDIIKLSNEQFKLLPIITEN